MHFGSSQIVLNLLIFGHLMKIGGLHLNGSGLNIRTSVVCINLFESCPLCDVLGSGGEVISLRERRGHWNWASEFLLCIFSLC